MPEITLHCKHDSDDVIRVFRDSDNEIAFRNPGSTVFTTDEGAREFANKILDFVGRDASGADAPVKVGDYVEVTKDRDWTSEDVGRRGHVTRLDEGTSLPYRVKLDDGDDVWFMEVRKVPATASTFSAHVEEAKRLLTGTPHYGADVITLARELAERA